MSELRFKPNTWYRCTVEDFYLKLYIETISNMGIDFRFVNKDENYYHRTRLYDLQRLRFNEFEEVADQHTLDLLYEPR